MTIAQPPGQPGQNPSPGGQGQPPQLATALVDTPDGQRLAAIILAGAVQVTTLLTAADAKTWAKALADAAASMSSSGLVVAAGPVKM